MNEEKDKPILGHAAFYPYSIDTGIDKMKDAVIAIDNLYDKNEKNKIKYNIEKKSHLMLDLETFGTVADSVVLSIGAVPFDMDGNIGKDFEIYPEIESQFSERKIQWSSIQWWFKQEQSIRFQQIDAIRNFDLKRCLEELNSFCNIHLRDNFKIWGNGFDVALLNQAYSQFGMTTPYSYKNILDVRTVVWLSKISVKKYGIDKTKAHNALEDCKYQISFLIDGYKILKGY